VAKIVNMHEAKTSLSKLVEEAESGEEIIIARAGKPVVRLVPIQPDKKRRLGQWKGKVKMSADFDAPLSPDELIHWEGDS
jgi:prevent-host-death family protein